jgi:hypothetical protein
MKNLLIPFLETKEFIVSFKSIGNFIFYALTTLNIEVIRALDHLYVAELFRNSIKYVPVILGVVINYSNNQSYLVAVFFGGFLLLSFITTVIVLLFFQNPDCKFSGSYFI